MREIKFRDLLKPVSYGLLAPDGDSGDSYCLYCHNDMVEAMHDVICPVTLARSILKEYGTPLFLYEIEYEAHYAYYSTEWRVERARVFAFTEQEALTGYEDSPNQEDTRIFKRRHAKATIIREAP